MKTWKKLSIAAGAAVVLAVAAWITVRRMNQGIVVVQTGRVIREDLTSLVTASGEIKPLTYSNIMAEGFGKITELVVREGDQVRRGDVLLRLENVQPEADVAAQRAGLDSAQAAVKSAEATAVSAAADVEQRKADLDKARFNWDRGQQLFQAGLIARQEYDSIKAAHDSAVAALAASQARLDQSHADLDRSRSNLRQSQAVLARAADVLRKTTYRAPIGGVATYIAVRVGENVVPGIQNASGSYLMTISDMSVVTAEVLVDETEITNVRTGQTAEVTIDALSGKVFPGSVIQVGTQAVLRTSGLATTQSTTGSQEAKDFKVVVRLDNPPVGLRPGLSATAKTTTAQKKNVLAIPLQALAIRTRRELDQAVAPNTPGATLAASRPSAAAREEVQGVFVVRDKQAVFVPVQTGITGVSEIEITEGLSEGDEIVTGSYAALRTLRPSAAVRVDNAPPTRAVNPG
ncbi:MAG TPA: efflux RND transporter periplasmic adaptor subunit [Candidatus Acidoferrales bacterium]